MTQDAGRTQDAKQLRDLSSNAGRRRGVVALLAIGLGAAAALGGCVSEGSPTSSGRSQRDPYPQQPQQGQQQNLPDLAKAREMALRAQRTKNPERAIDLYNQAVRAFPGFSAAWNNLGVLLMSDEQYLEAAEAFRAAADQSPADPRPLYNLAVLWDKQGWPEDALRFYLEALERDPRYQPALRGAIRNETLLGEADEKTLERLRTALLQENNDRWREYLLLQKTRVMRTVEEMEASMYSLPRRRSEEGDTESAPIPAPGPMMPETSPPERENGESGG